jgi:hypothetical protein
LRQKEINSYHACKKPLLTPSNRIKRFKFCKKHLDWSAWAAFRANILTNHFPVSMMAIDNNTLKQISEHVSNNPDSY